MLVLPDIIYFETFEVYYLWCKVDSMKMKVQSNTNISIQYYSFIHY